MLFQVVQRPDARAEDDVFATENASAAIAKILHYNAAKVQNWQEIAAAWIDTLPIVNDEEATPYAYAFLAQLIDQYVPIPRCPCFLPPSLLTHHLTQTKPSRLLSTLQDLHLCRPGARGRNPSGPNRKPCRRLGQGAHSSHGHKSRTGRCDPFARAAAYSPGVLCITSLRIFRGVREVRGEGSARLLCR